MGAQASSPAWLKWMPTEHTDDAEALGNFNSPEAGRTDRRTLNRRRSAGRDSLHSLAPQRLQYRASLS